jgi:ABC-type Fe3+/spermidine/putrescine transport system ATPase subunit
LLIGEIEAIGQAGEVLVRLPIGQLVGKLATTSDNLEIGSPVRVLIRPEAIALGTTPVGGSQTNRVPVRVDEILFEGPLRRIRMSAPGDQVLELIGTSTVMSGMAVGSTSTALIPADQVSVIAY